MKRQYCGALGKPANCQVMVSLRLYLLSEDWTQDEERRARAKVPQSIMFEPKTRVALAQIDAAQSDGALATPAG